MSRAVVLGGGGVTGIAWETGVLEGLAEAGVDIEHWDMVVGTSAGAIVGAKLLGEPNFAAWYDAQAHDDYAAEDEIVRVLAGRIGSGSIFAGRRPRLRWLPRLWLTVTTVETIVRRAARPGFRRPAAPGDGTGPQQVAPPNPMLAHAGALGLVARTATQERYLEVVRNALAPLREWPRGLVVTAIDACDGSTVAFDASSGVDVVRAVASSTAVPMVFPTIMIDGRPYIDGGIGSQTNAGIAGEMDEIVAIVPINTGAFDRERAALEAAGRQVSVVRPSPAAALALGRDLELLDPARRPGAARTGREDGLRAGRAMLDEARLQRRSSAA